MSFARRRAPIACLFCRHRKRRCDGVKPICGLCAASGVDCEYSDKMSDIQKARQENASNEVLVQRINDLENMLKNQQSQEQETRQQQSTMSPGGAPSQSTPSQHTHSSPSPAPLPMETDEQVSPQPSHAPAISEQDVALGEPGFAGILSTPEALTPAFSPNTWRQLLPVVSPNTWRQLLPVVRPLQSHDHLDLPSRARDTPSSMHHHSSRPSHHHLKPLLASTYQEPGRLLSPEPVLRY